MVLNAKHNVVVQELQSSKKIPNYKVNSKKLKAILKAFNQKNKVTKVFRKKNMLYINVKLSKGPEVNHSYQITTNGDLIALDSFSLF